MDNGFSMLFFPDLYIIDIVETRVSNEKVKRISDNKELFGAFMMLTVSAITMVYGI